MVEEPISSGSSPSSQPNTPKTKVKFSCSYGGIILPRPSNGDLKYVGGKTRVISVPIDIKFEDLMAKLTYLMDGEMILKYQIVPEELETLVTVKRDEDLQLMFEECNRYENTRTPKLKTYLFPRNPPLLDNGSRELQSSLEQRYIDAINGIIRVPVKHQLAINACLSPTESPERCTIDTLNSGTSPTNNWQSGKGGLPRVQSSPSICSLEKQQEDGPETSNSQHVCHKHREQSNYSDGIPKSVIDPHRHQTEHVRYQVDYFPQYLQIPLSRDRYHGGCTKFMQYMGRHGAGSFHGSPHASHMRKGLL